MLRSLISRSLLVCALLLGVSFVPGLESTASAQALKVAVVDMNRAMNDIEEGKAARASLEKQFNDKKAALDKKQKELQTLQDELERKSSLLSEEAKRTKALELQQKYADFQNARMDAEQEMGNLQARMQDDLTDKLKATLSTIAQKEGYSLVVEKAVAWYSLPSYDITDKLIAAYNAQSKAAPKK